MIFQKVTFDQVRYLSLRENSYVLCQHHNFLMYHYVKKQTVHYKQ